MQRRKFSAVSVLKLSSLCEASQKHQLLLRKTSHRTIASAGGRYYDNTTEKYYTIHRLLRRRRGAFKMVRIKHRYLLVNILYPESPATTNKHNSQKPEDVPYTVEFHQPSSDRMDAKLLLRLIRDGVSELFGDYGSGMIAPSLQGTR